MRFTSDYGTLSHEAAMRNSLMDRAASGQADAIVTHPWHQQAMNTMIELVQGLRHCVKPRRLLPLPRPIVRSCARSRQTTRAGASGDQAARREVREAAGRCSGSVLGNGPFRYRDLETRGRGIRTRCSATPVDRRYANLAGLWLRPTDHRGIVSGQGRGAR